MSVASTIRMFSAVLFGLFLVLYIAAKFDFFTRYFQLGWSPYLREHSVYWAGMAAIAFLIWLIERRFPKERQ
jgi:hypothetical protein